MSTFKKIANKISSPQSVYKTPFLNFEYKGEIDQHKEDVQKTIKAFEGRIKKLDEILLNLKKEKDDLNNLALTKILNEQEQKKLSDLFTLIEKKELLSSRMSEEIRLIKNSEESFFKK